MMKARSRHSAGNRLSRLVLSGAILLLLGHGPARAASPGPGLLGVSIHEHQADPPRTNEWCPVLTDERVDFEIYTEHLGRRVFFCCRKCVKRFQADPADYAANLPASTLPSEMGSSPKQRATQDDHVGEAPAHEREHTVEEPPPDQEHDHAGHDGSSAHGVPAWILWIGRLHPMWVHFPIALLLVAALAELLAGRFGDARFAFAARFSLWGGTVGALVAAPLGWADALGVAEDYTGTPATLLFLGVGPS